jgi:hypothetical protein
MRKLLSTMLSCCLLSMVVTGRAQQTLGSLNGTVLDGSGAAVPGSTVTATDAAIGVTRTTKAQGNGYFQLFNLPVGSYTVTAMHEGFDTTALTGIEVQEAGAKTLTMTLKVGQISESVTVTSTPLLNATDDTNGYTLDKAQIALTPLATGSFTQLAVLSPGVSAELLSNLDTNSGLGNQPIWANGQRDTSNTFQVNGVDASNLFNGKSSSGSNSQRYNFNIGESSPVGGAYGDGTSVFGSNGNSLPSPPPEFIEELRVNTSMYDAQQGATSGAQIDVNTSSGTNRFHGQMYGSFANSSLNAAPYFFKQETRLSDQGVGAFPDFLANPSLHRWTTGATLGGPIVKDKLFFFVGYQHRYNSDQATGISQMTVPSGLTNDRSTAGLTVAADSYAGSPFTGTIGPIAQALLSAKLANGQYLIPSAQNTSGYQFSVPNVTLLGTSTLVADQADAGVDWDVTKTDRLSVKYYYQNDPVHKPYGFSQAGGFPVTQNNTAQVLAIDNTITLGTKINWEQRLGFDRMGSYSFFTQTLPADPSLGPTFGIGTGLTGYARGVLPGLTLKSFASNQADSPGLTVGPASPFVNLGYYQNRINPSTNIIFSVGNHTIVAGGGYSYTQLNIKNNRSGIADVETKNFDSFLEDQSYLSTVLESIDTTSGQASRNLADRYYRSNEIASYVQDKWQALPNLSITAGVRYDYHGGLTEKYGNMFNFDQSLYSVTGTVASGFNVSNAGFVIAGNNPYDATKGTTDSTLTGRQWGVSPRVGFAYSPKRFNNKLVINGGAGLYYDRGELFTYLSQPAGSGNGGPFGVTESAPLATYISKGIGKTLADPLGALNGEFNTPAQGGTYIPPSANPATIPIPINEPGLASPTNPIHGETDTYGFEVLNTNSESDGYDYDPIGSEPWNSEDGGNTDFRAPYIGFSPNVADFKTVGTSAYDAAVA